MQVEGFIPKAPKKKPKDKNKDKDLNLTGDGKVKFADRLRALLRNEDCALSLDPPASSGADPYAFTDPGSDEKIDNVLPGAFYQSRAFWNSSSKPVQTPNDRVTSNNNNKTIEQSNNLFGNFHQNDNNYSNMGGGNTIVAHLPPKTQQLQLGSLNNNSNSSTSSGCSNATPKSSCSSSGGPSCENVGASGGKTKPNGPKFAKTMNRLQAKIARNKVLDKLKKSQQESSTSQNGSKTSSLPVNQTVVPKLTFNATNIKKESGMINGNHKELLNRQPGLTQIPVSIRQIQQKALITNAKQPKSSSKSAASRASSSKGSKREATPSLTKVSAFPTPFGATVTNREQISSNLNPTVKSRPNKNVTFSSANPNLWALTSSSNSGVFFPSATAATNQNNYSVRNALQSAALSLAATSSLKDVKKEPPIELVNVKIEKPLPVSRKKELVEKLTQQSQKFSVKNRKNEDYIYHGKFL